MASKKRAPVAVKQVEDRWAVFEAHAVSWFGSEVEARAHADSLAAVRVAGEAPVVAKVV